MTDKEILKELTDQLLWYEEQEEKVATQLKAIQSQIAKDKRLIAFIEEKIKKAKDNDK